MPPQSKRPSRQADKDHLIAAVRRFSRFYTQRLKVLDEHLLDGPFSLPEARVVYELAHLVKPNAQDADGNNAGASAAALAEILEMDASYLSRVLRALERRDFVSRQRSSNDGREVVLSLTAQGRKAAQRNEQQSCRQVSKMLESIDPAAQERLLLALQTVESALSHHQKSTSELPSASPVVFRAPEPGDFGWVIQAHGRLYAQEYHWDERFEALVAKITAQFVESFQPQWERCWIAELNGQNVGSVFVVRQSKTIAKLRLLVLEPAARGHGIGRQLVEQSIRFAQQKGYRSLVLWTNKNLIAAVKLYESLGFELQSEEAHDSFGHSLIGQNYSLKL